MGLGKSAFRLPAVVVSRIKEQAVSEALEKMPAVDLSPALEAAAQAEARAENARQMVLNDRAREAVTAAETASSIDTLEEAITALNALSGSYEAALPASLADRQALHQQDAAFVVMVADLTARLEALKATDSGQASSLATQQSQIQTIMGQIADFLARPTVTLPKRYAARLQTDASGVATVTFPANLFNKPPTVLVGVETPAGATSPYAASLTAPATATGCTIKAWKSAAATVSLLGLVNLKLFEAPGVVWVNVMATEAT